MEDDINLLVQKLLITDWYEMDCELFTKLIIEAGKYAKEVIDMANKETIPENPQPLKTVTR